MSRLLVIACMCLLVAMPAHAQQGATVPELVMLACKRRLPSAREETRSACQVGVIMTLRTLCNMEKITGSNPKRNNSELLGDFVRCMYASATAVLDRAEAELKAHTPSH